MASCRFITGGYLNSVVTFASLVHVLPVNKDKGNSPALPLCP